MSCRSFQSLNKFYMSGEITVWEIGAKSVDEMGIDEMGFNETGINRANNRTHNSTGLL